MDAETLSMQPAPFQVQSVHDHELATITGFSENDPLDVGNGLGLSLGLDLNLKTAYFAGGGWCLVSDLVQHWDLADMKNVETISVCAHSLRGGYPIAVYPGQKHACEDTASSGGIPSLCQCVPVKIPLEEFGRLTSDQ